MMIIDTNTDEQVEDLGYFAKECSILGKIRLNPSYVNAVLFEVGFCIMKMLGRIQQSFGWNASYIQAGASKRIVFFDQSGFEP